MPAQIRDLSEGDIGFPMDGQSLGRLMHKRGINMRYLGKIAMLAKEQKSRLEALQGLAVQEMIARSFKHVANRYLKNLPAIFVTNCLSHLLNLLLGAVLNPKPPVHLDEDVQAMYLDGDWSFKDVSVESLREQIQDQIHLRYRYTIESGWYSRLKSLQLLREVCLKLGLQLAAKDYQFHSKPVPHVNGVTNGNGNGATNGASHLPNGLTSKKKKKNGDQASQSSDSLLLDPPTTFSPDDILNIVPIVKDSCPRSDIAEETLEAARVSLMQNQRELGQELLLESLSLHEQIYGILHPEVARVYHQLSMLYYQLEEKNAAVELARKAVIVFERTLGLDSNETILSYQNLGLFEHANGNTKLALWYMKHALELWKIIYGLKHPDSITTINNAAVMLQNLKQYHESRIWFEKSLAISEEVSGKTSVNTATLCFQLAQALALDQEAKAAVNRMREAYSIFLAKLGKDDRNTKESESWLEQLTQNAVSIAKHAKDVQARRLRRVHLTPQMGTGMRPLRQVGQGSAEGTLGRSGRGSREIDERSVEELIRFIEGGGDTTKRSGVGAGARRNPKRRGGAKTSASAS
jgi:protein TIF31